MKITAVTFKDLRKRISNSSTLETSQQQQTRSFDILQDKPFWIWEVQDHKLKDFRTKGECCFNHIIGLPAKEGLEKPIFDYEKILYDALLSPDFQNPLNTLKILYSNYAKHVVKYLLSYLIRDFINNFHSFLIRRSIAI